MIRDAIRKSEHSGDQRSLSLLEDVRWAVLVPDALERQSGGIRRLTRARQKFGNARLPLANWGMLDAPG